MYIYDFQFYILRCMAKISIQYIIINKKELITINWKKKRKFIEYDSNFHQL